LAFRGATMPSFTTIDYLKPLAPGIWLVRGPENGRFPYCNGFLLAADRTALIDAGVGEARIREIDSRIRIDALVISHPHPDHILAWHLLADRQLFLPEQTPESVGDLRLLGHRFVDGRQDAAYWTWVMEHRLGIHPLREPDHRFGHGDILDFGGFELQAIHAPGHLDDHYCFLETRSGTLFSTDIDFTGFGPWYGNPEADIMRFRDSVKMLRGLPFRRICSSHKTPLLPSAAQGAFDRYLAAFDRQRKLVFDLCRKPADLETMVRYSPFYRNRMYDATFQRIFETQMVRKNLEVLIAQGVVVEKQGRYGLA